MSRYLLLTPTQTPSGEIISGMQLVNNVRPSHWQTATTILDFKTQTVTRAKIADTTITDWNTVIAQLYPTYSGIIDMLCQVNKITLDPAILPAGAAPIDQAALRAAIEDADRRAGIKRED